MWCFSKRKFAAGICRRSGLAGLIALLGTLPALGAYDHPGMTAGKGPLDLGASLSERHFRSAANLYQNALSVGALGVALEDRDGLISSEFRVPREMRHSVEFWLKVYTEYSGREIVFFDERHPEVIYGVLDLRELAGTARNAVVFEIVSKQRLDKMANEIRSALRKLASRGVRGRKLSALEQRIATAWKRSNHSHGFASAAEHLKAQRGQRDQVIRGLLAAEVYLPKMEAIFENAGVPAELTRLSLVESSFNMRAISRVGASGVWQFMRKSGEEFMLVNDSVGIDERLSPMKSTVAAARLLKRNLKILKSWPLAITAYNHGTRNLTRIPQRLKSPERIGAVFEPCGKKFGLGFASKNYYAEFLAMLHAEAYQERFFGKLPVTPLRGLVYRRATGGETGLALAMNAGISLQEFTILNPDILDLKRKLPKGFWVAVPSETDNLSGITERLKPGSSRRI